MAFDQNWKDTWEKRWKEWKEDLEKLQTQFQSGAKEAETAFEEQKSKFLTWLEEQRETFKETGKETSEEWNDFRQSFDKLIQKLSSSAEQDAKEAEEEISEQIEHLYSEAENLENQAKDTQKTLLDDFTDTMSRWQAQIKAAALNIQVETSDEFEEWREEARQRFSGMKDKLDQYAKDSSGEWKDLRSDMADILEKFASKLRSKPEEDQGNTEA